MFGVGIRGLLAPCLELVYRGIFGASIRGLLASCLELISRGMFGVSIRGLLAAGTAPAEGEHPGPLMVRGFLNE